MATRGFIASGDGFAIVAFTGTEIADPHQLPWNTLTDLDLRPAAGAAGSVHHGFDAAFRAVCCQVETVLGTVAGSGRRSVWFTGHSLGAAIATLAAVHWQGSASKALYTFGSPRVGDRTFAARASDAVPSYRFVHAQDIVARVPPELPSFDYSHVGREQSYFGDAGEPVDPTSFFRELVNSSAETLARGSESALDLWRILEIVRANGLSQETYVRSIKLIASSMPKPVRDHAPIYYMEYFKRQLA